MAVTREPTTDQEQRLASALPEGWRIGPVEHVIDFRPRPGHSADSFAVTFYGGAEAGTQPVIYSGGHGDRTTYRRVELHASGWTLDDLIAVAQRLPDLAPLTALPFPIEWRIDSDLYP